MWLHEEASHACLHCHTDRKSNQVLSIKKVVVIEGTKTPSVKIILTRELYLNNNKIREGKKNNPQAQNSETN